eukprot:1142854-Pelagomonas_calceolata.AAC.2
MDVETSLVDGLVASKVYEIATNIELCLQRSTSSAKAQHNAALTENIVITLSCREAYGGLGWGGKVLN